MKSFAKTLSLLGLILCLQAASTATSKPEAINKRPGAQDSNSDLYRGLSIDRLEVLEFDRPQDPYLKEALLKQYWCAGSRGLAINLNDWIQQHGPLSLKQKWSRLRPYMKGSYAHSPAELSSCGSLNSAN